MLKSFKLDRKILSSYYISVIFAYFVFIVFGEVVTETVKQFGLFLGENLGFNFVQDGRFWWFLITICFLFVLFLRQFIVEPLGFFVDTDVEPWWETAIFGFLVFGFFVYMINQAFGLPMPELIPQWATKLFGGYKNTYASFSPKTESQLGWPLMPYIWYLSPIVFMYIRRKLSLKA